MSLRSSRVRRGARSEAAASAREAEVIGPDPFGAGAVEIREPLLPSVPPTPRPVNLLVATIVICCAIVVSVNVFGPVTTRFAGYTVGAVAGGVYLVDEVRRAPRGSQTRPAGIALLVAVVPAPLAFVYLGGLLSVVLGAVAAVGGALAWRADARARAAVRDAAEQRRALEAAYLGAVAWNGVREVLRTAGTHVERNLGAPHFDEQLHIRTLDPATHETALRTLDEPLARDGWVVVDTEGAVIATAPPGAPEHWRAATSPTWPAA